MKNKNLMWLCKKKQEFNVTTYVIIKWGGINAFNLTQLI